MGVWRDRRRSLEREKLRAGVGMLVLNGNLDMVVALSGEWAHRFYGLAFKRWAVGIVVRVKK